MNKLKSILILITTVTASVILWSFVSSYKTERSKSVAVNKGFTVIELFTSEGCSSCPPADAAVAELLSKQFKDVYILSYHVDYWDRLGWKDAFSQATFSNRQREYAQKLSLEGVYTPQIVVNGTTQFVGSNKTELSSAVNNSRNNGTLSNLKITAVRKDNRAIVDYNITGKQTMLLNVAVVLPDAYTKVKRGENVGKTLHHVNIVSSLKVTEVNGTGQMSIEIDAAQIGKPLKIIAYTQDKQTLKVSGADEATL